MKPDPKQMPKPSVFELAQLATKFIPPGKEDAIRKEIAVDHALRLWEASAEAIEISDQRNAAIQALLSGLFTMHEDEWAARVADLKAEGTASYLRLCNAIGKARFTVADLTARLYKDKSVSSPTKARLLHALPKFIEDHSIKDCLSGQRILAEALSKKIDSGRVDGYAARALAVARMRVIGINKSRVIPLSARRRR